MTKEQIKSIKHCTEHCKAKISLEKDEDVSINLFRLTGKSGEHYYCLECKS